MSRELGVLPRQGPHWSRHRAGPSEGAVLTLLPLGPGGPPGPWGPEGPRAPGKPGAPAIPGAPCRGQNRLSPGVEGTGQVGGGHHRQL